MCSKSDSTLDEIIHRYLRVKKIKNLVKLKLKKVKLRAVLPNVDVVDDGEDDGQDDGTPFIRA